MKSPPGGTWVVALALAAGALLSMLLGGCGSSAPTLNTTAVERAIAESIHTERNVQVTVLCPAELPRKAGFAFTCAARLDVGSYPVAVTETDDAGHVRYANPAPLVALDVAKVERAVAASILAQRHLHAVVRCPAEVLQRAGIGFTCTAMVGGRGYPFAVTEVDGSGHVKYLGR
jgi:hypothetical protein